MTRTMVHAGARFAPGVGFSLFQQAELQAALSAVLPPPLLSFQIPGCLEVLYRLFYSGSGEGELPGNGSQRRPADPLGVGPVTEVDVDRLGPGGTAARPDKRIPANARHRLLSPLGAGRFFRNVPQQFGFHLWGYYPPPYRHTA